MAEHLIGGNTNYEGCKVTGAQTVAEAVTPTPQTLGLAANFKPGSTVPNGNGPSAGTSYTVG